MPSVVMSLGISAGAASVQGSSQMWRNSLVLRHAPIGEYRPISHGLEEGEHAR
jgi:hypothetical protein